MGPRRFLESGIHCLSSEKKIQTARKKNIFCARPGAPPLRLKERSYDDETKRLKYKIKFPTQALPRIRDSLLEIRKRNRAHGNVFCARPVARPLRLKERSYDDETKTLKCKIECPTQSLPRIRDSLLQIQRNAKKNACKKNMF